MPGSVKLWVDPLSAPHLHGQSETPTRHDELVRPPRDLRTRFACEDIACPWPAAGRRGPVGRVR